MNEESELDEFAPWLALAITGIGGILRVMLLGTKGMWLDETFSVWLASHSVPDLLQWTVRIDQHPPLYYLLLHSWIARYGVTPYEVRLLSALFGTATIPVIYLIGKRLSGTAMGLAAAVFLAFSTFNIVYAQETRMYTILTFNAAVATYALVRLLTDPRSVVPIGAQFRDALRLQAWRTSEPVEPEVPEEFSYRAEARPRTGWRAWIYRHRWPSLRAMETDLAWIAYIVFTAATLLTHNTAVLFVLAVNIFVLGMMLVQSRKRLSSPPGLQAPSFANWLKAQAGIFLLWSPWLLAFLRQASGVDREFWIPKPGWDAVVQVVIAFLNGYMPRQVSRVTLIWILYLPVLLLGLVHFRKRLSRFLFLAVLFAIPFLGELIVSLRRPIFLDRTLIWTTIPLFLILAAGVAQLKFRFLMIVVVGILATNGLFSAGDYYRFYQKEDWSTAAGYVALFAEQNDLVLFNSNFIEIAFDYYFETYEEGYGTRVEKRGIPQDLFASGVLEPRMTEGDIPGLISLLRGHQRVWLVYSHDSYTDPKGLVPQTVASQMKLTRTHDFYGGEVQLYEAR
jgi:hypothetical protein